MGEETTRQTKPAVLMWSLFAQQTCRLATLCVPNSSIWKFKNTPLSRNFKMKDFFINSSKPFPKLVQKPEISLVKSCEGRRDPDGQISSLIS